MRRATFPTASRRSVCRTIRIPSTRCGSGGASAIRPARGFRLRCEPAWTTCGPVPRTLPPTPGYKVLRDAALQATNARVTEAKRASQGQNKRWVVTVRPRSSEDVTVSLPATTDCDATGAVCIEDGRPLSNSNSATVAGPVGISVADARVEEGSDAV